jgi:alpha-D-ribose 1-methylphosphonate 5-triphosphate diphosphatase
VSGFALRAGRVYSDGRERVGATVLIEDGLIQDVVRLWPVGPRHVDVEGADLVPGLVDLHSDCLEVKARPRTTMLLPLGEALHELDAECAAHGVATQFICISLEDNVTKYRSIDRGLETVDEVTAWHSALRIDHRLHLRIDVTGDGIDVARGMARSPLVGLLSYMLHLPGYGQFADEESWRQYYTSVEGDPTAARDRLALRMQRLDRVAMGQRLVAEAARDGGAVLASHDDDSVGAIELARELGARIAEFPINLEAARAARSAGMSVVMGAPNARRGTSHHGNLSAREALAAGALDILASDYHPPSLLVAAYALAEEHMCSWPDAISLVTAAPAKAAMLVDRGDIRAGLRADLAAIGRRHDLPSVIQTWVAGQAVFAA